MPFYKITATGEPDSPQGIHPDAELDSAWVGIYNEQEGLYYVRCGAQKGLEEVTVQELPDWALGLVMADNLD